MKGRIDVGFVGTGDHARRSIYPSLKWAPLNLVAVCNRHGGNILKETARTFGAERTYTNYKEMFKEEALDAVIIVTGPDSYPQISIDAMQAGFHVFIEKPPANTLREAKQMAIASEETGKYLMVAFKKRFTPAYIKARDIMRSSEFGLPTSIDMRLRWRTSIENLERLKNPSPEKNYYSSPRYFILDYAIHHLDLVRFFMGDIEKIYFTVNKNSRLLSYVVVIRFKNGTTGTMHITQGDAYSTPQENVEIIGEGANVVIDNIIRLFYYRRMKRLPRDEYIGANEEAPLIWEPSFSLSGAVRVLVLEGYVGEIQHFAESILNNKQPTSNIHDGIEALRLVDALTSKPEKTICIDEIE
jgi:predicted dehydrogenase